MSWTNNTKEVLNNLLEAPKHRHAGAVIDALDQLRAINEREKALARADEWLWIHETLHSAGLVSQMHVDKLMDNRLNELAGVDHSPEALPSEEDLGGDTGTLPSRDNKETIQ